MKLKVVLQNEEDFVTSLVENTIAFQKALGIQEEVEDTTKSATVTSLEEFLKDRPFGCNTESVAKVFSIVLEEEVQYGKDELDMKDLDYPFIVEMESNPNGHDYPTDGRKSVVTHPDTDMHMYFNKTNDNFRNGNNLPFARTEEFSSSFKVLTEEEIREWYENLTGERKSNIVTELKRYGTVELE